MIFFVDLFLVKKSWKNGTALQLINSIQDWRTPNSPSFPAGVFPETFPKVRRSPQNFLAFSFNIFDELLSIFKAIFSTTPKLLNFKQNYASKNFFFRWNSYKIKVLITYRWVTKIWSHGHIDNIIWVRR